MKTTKPTKLPVLAQVISWHNIKWLYVGLGNKLQGDLSQSKNFNCFRLQLQLVPVMHSYASHGFRSLRRKWLMFSRSVEQLT